MDRDALETFLAVHRERSFSKAAVLLHRTQPAISRRIAMLEAELGVPLFERASGGVVLSQAGAALLPFADRALAAMRDAAEAVAALRRAPAGPLALAIVGTLAGPPLSRLLKDFAAGHPAVRLDLRTARSAEVSELVRRGQATIGVRYDRDRAADLDFQLIASEPVRVVCAPDHPLANRSVRRLAALREERWIAFPVAATPGGSHEAAAAHVFALFLTHELGEVDWIPIDSLTVQKRLVEAGFGLALMPASNAAEELGTGALAGIGVGDLRAHTQIFAVTRKGGFLSAAARQLLQLLRTEYARALPQPTSSRSQPRGG